MEEGAAGEGEGSGTTTRPSTCRTRTSRSVSARSSRLLVYNSRAASNSSGDSFGWEQDITLPELCAKPSNEEKALLVSTLKLEEFWRTSCYHLEEDAPKKSIMTQLITAYLFVHLTYA